MDNFHEWRQRIEHLYFCIFLSKASLAVQDKVIKEKWQTNFSEETKTTKTFPIPEFMDFFVSFFSPPAPRITRQRGVDFMKFMIPFNNTLKIIIKIINKYKNNINKKQEKLVKIENLISYDIWTEKITINFNDLMKTYNKKKVCCIMCEGREKRKGAYGLNVTFQMEILWLNPSNSLLVPSISHNAPMDFYLLFVVKWTIFTSCFCPLTHPQTPKP